MVKRCRLQDENLFEALHRLAAVFPISLGSDRDASESRLPQTPRAFLLQHWNVRCHFHCCLNHDTYAYLTLTYHRICKKQSLCACSLSLCFGVSTTTIDIVSQCCQHHTHPVMDRFQSLPNRSKKRDKDDAADSSLFIFPHPKRANHNDYKPQSNANRSSSSTASTEAMTRSLSPDGGVAIDEKALAGLSDYRHVVLSSDDDSNDDSSSDEGSQDDHPPLGRLSRPSHVAEEDDSSHHHNTSTNMPYTSPLPVFNHQRGEFKLDPGSSMLVYEPFRGLQSVQPLPTVMLNPRLVMVVEGGKLYLAQTLHHYYRKHIHCPHHGPIDGRPGHHRMARKVHEYGQVYRVWYCTTQPKGEGHRIDNTAYIELAKEQLHQALFDRVLCELIRQSRSRDCQPLGRNQPPQPDDFDYLALLSYIDR
jgi:hypothetical protein